MSKLAEEIPLEDVNPDDEYESTVGDTTGAVGGTPADTDLEVDKFKHQRTDRA